MKVKENCDLYQYNTMRLHSIANVVYFPESRKELITLVWDFKQKGQAYYVFSGGSNIIFVERVKTPLVCLMSIDNEINYLEDGTVTAGCSVRIQKLINFGKEHALGGFEYLYSLPASVGGIVYMNAGRGRMHHQQISDWLESVEYLDLTDMQVKTMHVDKSQWTYRCSPFHQMKAVILSATFRMKNSSVEEVAAKIQERKDMVKRSQEGNKPSCGSVFNKNNKYIMRLLRGKRIGGACYSKKTNNWISNDKNGTADDVIALIHKAQKLHRFFLQKCSLEIKIFE